jgi:methyl-accepting chemotaxis protein
MHPYNQTEKEIAAKHAAYKRDCQIQSETYHGAAGSLGYIDKPREMSGIANNLGGLAKSIGEMNSAIDQLEKRLHDVLRPAHPQPAEASGSLHAITASQSAVVEQIQMQRERMEQLISRVHDITSRFD